MKLFASKKTKIILYGFLYLIFFTLSFPAVIPGQSQPVNGHSIFSFCAFFIMPFYILMIRQVRKMRKRAALLYIFGIPANLFVFYWIFNSMYLFGGLGVYTSSLIMALMVLGEISLFWLPFTMIYTWLEKRKKASPHIIAGLWTVIEAARNFFPVDFYWSAIGHSQYNNPFFIQFASVGSIYILSFFIVWTSLLVFSWMEGQKRKAETAAWLAVFLLLSSVSVYRLWVFDNIPIEKTVKVTLFQPNINQYDRNRRRMSRRKIISIFDSLLQQVPEDTDILVWHEASFPARIDEDYRDYEALWNDIFPGQTFFPKQIVGLDMVNIEKKLTYNSAGFVENGKIQSVYHKLKLAPFGEYLPMEEFLNSIGMGTIVPSSVGRFNRGQFHTVYDFGIVKAAVLICFDGTFSENVRAFVKNDAELLVSITNDAWFDFSSAVYQHHSFYPFRAVESGRTIVRSANVGISGMILPDGSVPVKTEIFKRDIITVDAPIYNIKTFYRTYGNVVLWMIVLWTIIYLMKVKYHENRKS